MRSVGESVVPLILGFLVRPSVCLLYGHTHRIHGAGIYANIGGILMVNVTIYSSTMDPMGYWVVIKTLPTSIFRGLHMAPHGSTSCQSDIALFKVHTGVLGDMWKAPPKAAVEALFEA